MSLETPASRGDDFTSSPREVSIGAGTGAECTGEALEGGKNPRYGESFRISTAHHV